jgi:hypothetical protein
MVMDAVVERCVEQSTVTVMGRLALQGDRSRHGGRGA